MQKDRFYQLMFSSLDGTITNTELSEFERLLAEDPGLRAEYEQFLQAREALQSWSAGEAGRWTDSQVQRLVSRAMERPETVIVALGRYWQKIAAACAIILLVSIGSIYLQGGKLDSDTLVGIDEIEAEEAYTYLSMNYTYDE